MEYYYSGRFMSKAHKMSQTKTCIKAPCSLRLLSLGQLQQLAHATSRIFSLHR